MIPDDIRPLIPDDGEFHRIDISYNEGVRAVYLDGKLVSDSD